MSSGFLGRGMGPNALGGGSSAPADPVPVAGAELLTNGNMETGDPPSNWTANAGSTLSSFADERTGGSGAKSLNIVRGSDNHAANQIIYSVTTDRWFVGNIYAKSLTGNNVGWWMATTNAPTFNVPAVDWLALPCTGRSYTTIIVCRLQIYAGEARFDDASVKPLTLSSLISASLYASADIDLSAAITRTAGTQAGLCARVDSSTSPANFIIAYQDGAGNVKVDKCVAGAYTNVITGAVTYAAGRVLRLVCAGNDVSCYYNGAQVGSTVTVSDAGIVSNVRHGKFSTYAANTFSGYTAA